MDELSGNLEFPTDPQLMAEVTADDRYDPLLILLTLELEVESGELSSIEEYFEMTKSTTKETTSESTPVTTDDAKDVIFLNKPMPNAMGALYIDANAHAYFTEEAARLKKRQVNSLYWVAMYTCGFDELPTQDDVFNKAQQIVAAPDAHLYVRDNHSDSHAYHEQETRQAVSGNQYARIMENAQSVLRNAPVIKLLESLGYTADHLTRTDLYTEVNEVQKARVMKRKGQEDRNKLAQKQVMQAASTQVNFGI